MSEVPVDAAQSEWDPVFLHARREARFVFGTWVVALLWSLPCCYWLGYPEQFDPQEFSTIFGIPSWVFWGIALPWLVADAVTIWFCFGMMQDDSLEPAEAVEDA